MYALVAVLLAAAPAELIVADRPEARAALEKALPKATLLDATAVNRYLLHPNGLLLMQDFSEFSAEPIAGWPPELTDLWKKNLKICRIIAGPAPYRDTLHATIACAQRLSQVLWQKFLDHAAPRRVYELTAAVDAKRGKAQVTGVTYEARGLEVLTVTEEAPAKELPAAFQRVADALIARKGTAGRRELVTEVANVPTADPLAHEMVVTAPVELKKSCAALPKELDVSPRTILGKSLAARWTASVKGTVPPQACNLQISQRDEELMGRPATVITAALECGGKTASAEAATRVAKGTTTEVLSARLVSLLAARFCK